MATKGIRVRKRKRVIIHTHKEIVQTPFKQLSYNPQTIDPSDYYYHLNACLWTITFLPFVCNAFHTSLSLENSFLGITVFRCRGQLSFFMAPVITVVKNVPFLLAPFNLLVSHLVSSAWSPMPGTSWCSIIAELRTSFSRYIWILLHPYAQSLNKIYQVPTECQAIWMLERQEWTKDINPLSS